MKENTYDSPTFFEQYSKMDRSVRGLRGAGEWHSLREMLPDLHGKRLLDLGCGYGWHCKYAIEQGAASVVGIDISRNMIARAREINADPAIQYHVTAVEDFTYPQHEYDIVLSSLALHYCEDFGTLCQKIRSCLREGGHFIFSVEHPVFTAQGPQQWHTDGQGTILHWPVDSYFSEGPRCANFLGQDVRKYHRTLTSYIHGLFAAGFTLTHLIEPQPEQALLDSVAGMRDELRRPMMLLLGAHV